MKNKEYYQRTFSRLTASENVIQEVLHMDQKKVYRFTKKTAGIAAAAALTLTATGAAYAATDGNISQLLERITVYINEEEASLVDYDMTPDGDGAYTFHINGEEPSSDVSVTVNPETGDIGSEIDYSISLDTDRLLAEADDVPFTLEAENDRLYLVEGNGDRLDVTEAAASEGGYLYTWTNADGTEQKAIVLGTPEEHCIASMTDSVEISSDADAAVSANVAVEK